MGAEFKPEITLGEIIGISLAMIPVALWAWMRWRQVHPFRVSYPKIEPIKALEYDRKEVRAWTAPLGFSEVPVIVRNRFGTNLRWFGPRLGERSYQPSRSRWRLSWSNAPKSTVRVCGVKIMPKRGVTYPHRRLITDEVDVHFDGYPWAANEPLEFRLLIEATRDWDGILSFYSRNEQHDQRCYGYAKLRVRRDGDCDGRALLTPDAKARIADQEWALARGDDLDV